MGTTIDRACARASGFAPVDSIFRPGVSATIASWVRGNLGLHERIAAITNVFRI
jgi:hypothetical protein